MEEFLSKHARERTIALGTHQPNHANDEFIYLGQDPEAFVHEAKLAAAEYLKKVKAARIEVSAQPVRVTVKHAPALAKRIISLLKK